MQVERWGGFVWVYLDAGAPHCSTTSTRYPLLAPYHLTGSASGPSCRPCSLPTGRSPSTPSTRVTTSGTRPQLLPWTDDVNLDYEPLGIHSHYGRLPNARRQLRPSPRLGLSEGEYDEGEILEKFIQGLGDLFLEEERALVDEILTAPTEAATMLGRYQKGPRALLADRGVAGDGFADDQLTSADNVYFFPNIVGPIYPGTAILFPRSSQRHRSDSCLKDTWFLEWPREKEGPPKRAKRRFFADWTERDWGEITNQDYANMEHVQIGMKASGGPAIRLNRRQEVDISNASSDRPGPRGGT